MKKSIFIFLFFLVSVQVFGQYYNNRHYTTDNGMPSNSVYDVHQDKKGYIWFTTCNGICRYNGTSFESFASDSSIKNNSAVRLYEDQKGKMWFMLYTNKLAYFENDTVHEFKPVSKVTQNFKANQFDLFSMHTELNGDIFLAYRRTGIFKFSANKDAELIKHADGNKTIIYVKSNNDVLWLNKQQFPDLEDVIYFPDKTYKLAAVNRYIKSTEKKVAVRTEIKYTGKYLIESLANYLFIFENSKLVYHTTFDSPVTRLQYTDNGELWVCTYGNGAYQYPDINTKITKGVNVLKNKRISSMTRDTEGGYWFTTTDKGVYYIPSLYHKNYFEYVNNEHNSIKVLTKSDSSVWTVSENTLIRFNNDSIYTYPLKFKDNFLINNIIYHKEKQSVFICRESGDSQFCEISINLLKKLARENKHKICPTRYTIQNHAPKTMYITKSGKVLTGVHGIFELTSNKETKKYSVGKDIKESVFAIQETNDNEFLIGTVKGLRYITDKKTIFPNKNQHILYQRISSLAYDSADKTEFIGTHSAGLIIKQGDKLKVLNRHNGMIDNKINCLYLYRDTLWVGTSNGLHQITFNKNKFDVKIKAFTKNHGLSSNQINAVEILNDKMYLATNKGLNVIDYQKLKQNNTKPPIYISKITVNNKTLPLQASYNLKNDENFIKIEFIGIALKAGNNTYYKYKMEGFSDTMNKTKNTSIQFTSLPSGDYTFSVFAVNEDSICSQTPAVITFHIDKHFTEKWWFYLFIMSILTGGLFLFIKIRTGNFERKAEFTQALAREKQKAYAQQMNPHFIFNSLNSIQYYIYKNDKISSGKYLAGFAKLIRTMLDNSEYETIALEEDIENLKLYMRLERRRLEDKFDFEVFIDPKISDMQIRIPTMLIQPIIENAIWHGISHLEKKGKLDLKYKLAENKLIIEVKDNGVGRKKAAEINKGIREDHISHSSSILKKRLELLNKLETNSITIEYTDLYEDNKASGTLVKLKILINDYLDNE